MQQVSTTDVFRMLILLKGALLVEMELLRIFMPYGHHVMVVYEVYLIRLVYINTISLFPSYPSPVSATTMSCKGLSMPIVLSISCLLASK